MSGVGMAESEATVDAEDLARDPLSSRHEFDGLGDFVGGTDSAERVRGRHPLHLARAAPSSHRPARWLISVNTAPGRTHDTLTPCGPSSVASTAVSVSIATFVAA